VTTLPVKRPVMPHTSDKFNHGSRKKLPIELEWFVPLTTDENSEEEKDEEEEVVKGLVETCTETKETYKLSFECSFF